MVISPAKVLRFDHSEIKCFQCLSFHEKLLFWFTNWHVNVNRRDGIQLGKLIIDAPPSFLLLFKRCYCQSITLQKYILHVVELVGRWTLGTVLLLMEGGNPAIDT